MTDAQLKIIVGLVTGCQTAIITLTDYLSKIEALDKTDIAQHFENTAFNIPIETQQRELIRMVLQQVAQGIRSVKPSDPDPIEQLFH